MCRNDINRSVQVAVLMLYISGQLRLEVEGTMKFILIDMALEVMTGPRF